MKKLAIFALALSATTAWAQDVPNHSVPIGRGPGVIGWGFTAACTTGNILSCNNSGNSDPTFQAFSGNLSLNNNQIYVGNVSNIGVSVPMSGDCSIIASGAITCTKTSGIAFGYFATGTSAGNLTGVLGLSQLPAFGSGDVTCGAGGSPCTVSPQAITFGKMQAMSPLSLVGVSGTAFASPGSIIGTANQIPIINNGGTLLAFTTVSGDLSNATGAFTISPLAVTNAKMAQMAASTFKMNPTTAAAGPVDQTIDGLTAKASPASNDEVIIWSVSDTALRKTTSGAIGSVGSVASVNTQTGTVVFLVPPQGRLTLVSALPIMITNQTAKGTIYYDCYLGNQVPYYTGSADAVDTISGCEVSTTMVSAASAGQVVSGQVYDIWWVHSGANRICLAMSASSGGGGGWASDGGTATARGTGYSQLDYTSRPYITNKNSITNCFNGATNYGSISANQATYLGTTYATANGQTGMNFSASALGGGANILGLYNGYNQVPMTVVNKDTTATWSYSSTTWRNMDGNVNNSLSYVDGLARSVVDVTAQDPASSFYGNSSGGVIGLSLNWSSGQPTFADNCPTGFNSTRAGGTCVIRGVFSPVMGYNSIVAVEASVDGNTQLFGSQIISSTNAGESIVGIISGM